MRPSEASEPKMEASRFGELELPELLEPSQEPEPEPGSGDGTEGSSGVLRILRPLGVLRLRLLDDDRVGLDVEDDRVGLGGL